MQKQKNVKQSANFAFGIGALVVFGGAFWASLLPVHFYTVIAMMSVPSLFLGYYFAPVFNKYLLGVLSGIVLYMLLERLLYGPVFLVTAPVYGSAYLFAAGSVLLARWFYNRRQPVACAA